MKMELSETEIVDLINQIRHEPENLFESRELILSNLLITGVTLNGLRKAISAQSASGWPGYLVSQPRLL